MRSQGHSVAHHCLGILIFWRDTKRYILVSEVGLLQNNFVNLKIFFSTCLFGMAVQ